MAAEEFDGHRAATSRADGELPGPAGDVRAGLSTETANAEAEVAGFRGRHRAAVGGLRSADGKTKDGGYVNSVGATTELDSEE